MNEFEQFLKSLELDEGKIKTIVDKFNSAIKETSSKIEKDIMEKFKDYDEVKDKASTLEKDLEKVNSTLEEKSNAYKTLEETLEKSNKDWESKLNDTVIGKEIEKSLLNVKNGELLIPQINKESIKLNKDGKVEGLAEQMETLKANYPDFFNSEKQLSGQAPQQNTQSPQLVNFDEMNSKELAKNWTKFMESKRR